MTLDDLISELQLKRSDDPELGSKDVWIIPTQGEDPYSVRTVVHDDDGAYLEVE